MLITSVEKSKKNKDRLLVYIDDNYAFSISEEDYLILNLYEKREIIKDETDYIKDVVNYKAAKSAGVKYLSLKMRCRREVGVKLENEGFSTETIDKVLDELTSMGYLNDRIYVQKFVFDRSKLKPKSKKMLKLELMNKGVEAHIIDEVLDEWEIDEASMAENLVRKKFGKYDLNDEKVKRKVFAFLHHRGFGYDMIGEVVNKLLDRTR